MHGFDRWFRIAVRVEAAVAEVRIDHSSHQFLQLQVLIVGRRRVFDTLERRATLAIEVQWRGKAAAGGKDFM
jgi:hypothetical protein